MNQPWYFQSLIHLFINSFTPIFYFSFIHSNRVFNTGTKKLQFNSIVPISIKQSISSALPLGRSLVSNSSNQLGLVPPSSRYHTKSPLEDHRSSQLSFVPLFVYPPSSPPSHPSTDFVLSEYVQFNSPFFLWLLTTSFVPLLLMPALHDHLVQHRPNPPPFSTSERFVFKNWQSVPPTSPPPPSVLV